MNPSHLRATVASISAVCAAAVIIAACGDDPARGGQPAHLDAGEGGSVELTTGASGVQQLAQEYCRFAQRCRENLFRANWTGVDDCVAAYRIDLETTTRRPHAAVVDAQMAACASKVKATTTCAVAFDQELECNYRGDGPSGMDCREPGQCASGSCTILDAGSACGVCNEPVDVGGDCLDGNCKPGLAYRASPDRKTCTCVTPGKEGESCFGQMCLGGLVCVSGTCKRSLQLGEACVEGAADLCDFDRDYYCNSGVCVQRVRAKLGQVCDRTNQCEASTCVRGVCVAYAFAGSVCGSSDVPYCSFELACEHDADGGNSCMPRDAKICGRP